jgi:hypothetical protein
MNEQQRRANRRLGFILLGVVMAFALGFAAKITLLT